MPPDADPQAPLVRRKKEVVNAVFSTWLGTTMEYVDFALYGLAAGLVFGDVFFPGASPAVALLSGFSTYAVGFLARPVGAFVFGRFGDKYGRKAVLVITISMMGAATTLIGLLPGYAQVGFWAPALLVVLRLMQGFGAGAELSGGVILLAEHAPARHRGLVSSVIALGSNSGILLSSGVWLLIMQLPMSDVVGWAWRIPFVGSALITIVALVIRRSLTESPVFEQHKTDATAQGLVRNTDRRIARSGSSKAFFVMLGLRVAENGPSYLSQTFMVGYVAKVLVVDQSVPATAVFIASVLGLAIIPLTGYLSDRFGRRPVYRFFCAALTVFPFPAYALLDTRNPAIIFAVIVVGVSLACVGIFAAQAAYGVELFGIRNRYTKMAMAKEIGAMFSGGIAPVAASALLVAFGHWWAVAAYFCIMALIGFVTTLVAPETRGRDLTLAEDAS
ncbi:MFS transporter [Arthrobacter sp. NPDC090010]|uniref:MFS transporter n=1 Tax=Arthrobacter sp. NPDC090010 TaxID=3363942 RepID=UPI0037F886BE